MSTYAKPYLTYQQQVQRIRERGLAISNEANALGLLRRIGYYRLSAYWYGFREDAPPGVQGAPKLDVFRPGYTFEHAVALYVFDKRLRMLLMDAIERIEVAIRAEIAHILGRQSTFAYIDPAFFRDHFIKDVNPKSQLTWHQDWLTNLDRLVNRSGETFVEHNKTKYGLPLALWVAIEVWDFGLTSKFVEGLNDHYRELIANAFNLSSGKVFAGWIRSLTYLRNVCAHYARLWNKNIVDRPRLPTIGTAPTLDHLRAEVAMTSRVYGLLCILIYLMDAMNEHSGWKHRLKDHLLTFPDVPGFGLRDMGFPEQWRAELIWASHRPSI